MKTNPETLRSILHPAVLLWLVLLLLCASFPCAGAGNSNVTEKFIAGQYAQAHDLLAEETDSEQQNDFQLMNLLLTVDSGQSDALLGTLRHDDPKSDPWQVRWALESANLDFARGEFQHALQLLKPFVHGGNEDVPGQVYLRAGLACRALKRFQRAREIFASVKPQDSSFSLARFYLGDIALEQGDPELALRYFESSSAAAGTEGQSMAKGGRYAALLALGRQGEAATLAQKLRKVEQGGLTWLDLDENATPAPSVEDSTDVAPDGAGSARFCLQWAAFRDRTLALTFVAQHTLDIPELRIVSAPDLSGQLLFYVRSGHYNNPVDARSQASELGSRLQMDVIVKDIKMDF